MAKDEGWGPRLAATPKEREAKQEAEMLARVVAQPMSGQLCRAVGEITKLHTEAF